MNTSYFFILLSIFLVWLGVVTFFVVKFYKKFGVLKDNVKKELGSDGFNEVRSRLTSLEKKSSFYVQKVALTRFNPFSELGGDHSFSLAILDGEDSGLVLTSLHTRDRTRVYLKEIKKAKSDVDLSAEEKKVLEKAKNQKL